MRCDCDYDCVGDPLRFEKCSHYCPEHDECEGCGGGMGVMKDPTYPEDYIGPPHRPLWLCAVCAKEGPDNAPDSESRDR